MDIKTVFGEALLSQAAYATLTADLSKEGIITALQNDSLVGGVTQAQAEYFAEHYIVVQQDNNPETGFSATLFQNIESGEYHLAMRGSDSILSLDVDWTGANFQNAKYGMAYDQVTDLINFYLRLTTASDTYIAQYSFEQVTLELGSTAPESAILIGHEQDDDTLDDINDIYLTFEKTSSASGLGDSAPGFSEQNINVTGHSLGGHLASAFSVLLPFAVNQTTTFDSAGFVGSKFDEFASAIAETLGGLQPQTLAEFSGDITDFKAPLDPVSKLGSHLGGGLVDVFIETKDGLLDPVEFESHNMDKLVDSLAVMNLLYTLDNSIDLTRANELLPLGSDDEGTELEGTMNHLARLFDQGEVAITNIEGNEHDDVYIAINKITENLNGKTYTISNITGSIVEQTLAGDKAALYAIINLQPFTVVGTTQAFTDALYQPHSDNEALNVDSYSESYLNDRADMLQWLIKHNGENESYGDKYDAGSFDDNITYTDLASDINNGQDLESKIDGEDFAAMPVSHTPLRKAA